MKNMSEQGTRSLDEIAAAVVGMLAKQHGTIAVAESCTGGLIAEALTRVPGASAVFGFGWVTYSNEAKEHLLGVPKSVLVSETAVSEPVVRCMAEGALSRSHADIAVSVSGYAGPGGGTDKIPLGTVWMAWALRGRPTQTQCIYRPMPRTPFREMVAVSALNGVLRFLPRCE